MKGLTLPDCLHGVGLLCRIGVVLRLFGKPIGATEVPAEVATRSFLRGKNRYLLGSDEVHILAHRGLILAKLLLECLCLTHFEIALCSYIDESRVQST